MVYRTGSFQKEKVVEAGAGVAFFYPKKKLRSLFVVKRHTQYLNSLISSHGSLRDSWKVLLSVLAHFYSEASTAFEMEVVAISPSRTPGSPFVPSVPNREPCQGSCEHPAQGALLGLPEALPALPQSHV